MKRIWVLSRLVCHLVEVDIDSRDIVVDGVVSLPNSSISGQQGASPRFSNNAYLSKSFPVAFHFRRLLSPLFANDFGYFGVCKSRMLGDDLCLIMLTVKDESYKEYQFPSLDERLFQ